MCVSVCAFVTFVYLCVHSVCVYMLSVRACVVCVCACECVTFVQDLIKSSFSCLLKVKSNIQLFSSKPGTS